MDLLTRVVAAFEAFSGQVYKDGAGHPTIGYGHKLRPDEAFPHGIMREQALLLLDDDVRDARRSTEVVMRGALLQDYEKDALTCFVYNLGQNALAGSTLRQKVLAGQRLAAAAEFLKWNKARDPLTGELTVRAGLTRRRHCESVWFLGAAEATVVWLAQAAER
jgi:lysozyme